MNFVKTSIAPAAIGRHCVYIERDAEAGEFRCRLFTDNTARPEFDYFTTKADDARRTAWNMARIVHNYSLNQHRYRATPQTAL